MRTDQEIVPARNGAGTVPAPAERRSRQRATDSDSLIDLDRVRDLGMFVWNAIRRHKLLVAAVFIAFPIAAALSVAVLPRKYYAETKLLADRNVVMPLLGNPSRRLPDEADTPTRLASEIIMNNDNLKAIVVATNLVKETAKRSSIASRTKTKLIEGVFGSPTDPERIDGMIVTLRKFMSVQVGDGTVTIGVTWADPDLAYRIVQTAQQNFIEERQSQELSLITGSISILEKNASSVQDDITGALDSLSRDRSAMLPKEARRTSASAPVRKVAVNPELTDAQSRLDGTVRAIDDLVQFRNRRLAELQATLADERNRYGAAHPQIENTQQLIRSMMSDSPQLTALRADEQQLRATIARLGGAVVAPVAVTGDQAIAAVALRSLESMRNDSLVEDKQQYGRSRLRIAVASYQELLERLDAARMELQTVRATFKYKYGILTPAAVPKTSVSISPLIVLVGATMLGAMLAVFSAIVLDLGGGRLLESWQIEHSLGIPVLGEVRHS